MLKNPYKFTGPLDPEKDKRVCVPRQEEVNWVIKRAIHWGDYWAVIGPRQSGKTTFLRQVQHYCQDAHFVFFDLETCPSTETDFYLWLTDKIKEAIPSDTDSQANSAFEFVNFLTNFKRTFSDGQKIIFLFDEIEAAPNIVSFLKAWRTIYIERYNKNPLNKYGIIITGSIDLVKESEGKTSPFNVVNTLYLRDLAESEANWLVEAPFNELKINFEKKAKRKLINRVGGHPQILQHICHRLVYLSQKKGRVIHDNDIDNTIKYLFLNNSNLSLLYEEVKRNYILKNLVIDTMNRKKINFFNFREFAITGTGPIVENNEGFCTIRNNIYYKFLANILDIPTTKKESTFNSKYVELHKTNERTSKIFICYSHEDDEILREILTFLEPLRRKGTFIIFYDQKILPGEKYLEKISDNIKSADIALFLLSINSLNSKFITEEEIPELIEGEQNRGLSFFPILVSPCPWETEQWLRERQIWPTGDKAIEEYKAVEKRRLLTKLVYVISNILDPNKSKKQNEFA